MPDSPIAARPDVSPDSFTGITASELPTAARPDKSRALFAAGDEVVCRHSASTGHTRLPAYLRGVAGHVIACHGKWVFPDSNAHGRGEDPQHLYTVEFEGPAVWAHTGEQDLSVCIDLFEPYLESLSGGS